MHSLAFLCALAAASCTGAAHASDAKLILAQTSTTTNCMMSCNSQAANCQTACLIPTTPTTGTTSAATTNNPNQNASCQLTCTTQQLSCQTNCARASPSQ